MSVNLQPTGDFGSDGLGFPKTVIANAVRMYAENVTQNRTTSIRITGLTTGATWNVVVVVKPGPEITTESPIPIF